MTGQAVIIDTAMPAAQYHATDAVSASLLKQIAKSPAHARAYLQQQQEPTAAMLFGTAFHMAVLESERFDNEYAVFEGDKRTKAGKETYESLVASGKTIISATDYAIITAMAEAIGDHPAASKLVRGDGKTEVSMFWEDEETGLKCKCRKDIWLERGRGSITVDLKSTDDASPQGFSRSIEKYGYNIQASHYLETGDDAFLFVACEKNPPFAVAVYELDPLSLEVSKIKRRSLLEYWANCRKAEMYPAYSDECQMISLPAWVMKGNENV